jgi:hypothetical protein
MQVLGQEDTLAKQQALEGVQNPLKIAELEAKDWTFTTTDLASDISQVTSNLDTDIISEELPAPMNELINYYWEIRSQADYYYNELTEDEQQAYKAANPGFVIGMLFWGMRGWETIRDDNERRGLEELARKYNIPYNSIPAFNKKESNNGGGVPNLEKGIPKITIPSIGGGKTGSKFKW